MAYLRQALDAGALDAGEAAVFERVALHQLAPLLHHCALYGRSYAERAMAAARLYV